MDTRKIMALGAMAALASMNPISINYDRFNYEPLDQYSTPFRRGPRRNFATGKIIGGPADPKKKAQRKAQGKARARSRK